MIKFLEKSGSITLNEEDVHSIRLMRDFYGVKGEHPTVTAIATLILNKVEDAEA